MIVIYMKACNACIIIVNNTKNNSVTLKNYRCPILNCRIKNLLLTFLFQRKGIMASFVSIMASFVIKLRSSSY